MLLFHPLRVFTSTTALAFSFERCETQFNLSASKTPQHLTERFLAALFRSKAEEWLGLGMMANPKHMNKGLADNTTFMSRTQYIQTRSFADLYERKH